MSKVSIYYTIFEDEDRPIDVKYIHALPPSLSKEILLYRKQDDINRLTAGKYLLKKILSDHYSSVSLETYSIDELGKPFIPGLFDFNITHSGKVVACAILHSEGKIGIDTEKIRSIEVEKFGKQFSPPELMQILGDKDPQTKFFDYWTMKEAVMKADGRGMRIPLHSIRLKGNHATIDDVDGKWNLKSLEIHPSVRCHMSTQNSIEDVELIRLPIEKLFI